MDWGTIIALVGTQVALIYWLRSDMKDFMGKIDNKMDSMSVDIRSVLIRLERHECHINYLMEGRKPILAPEEE